MRPTVSLRRMNDAIVAAAAEPPCWRSKNSSSSSITSSLICENSRSVW